MSKDISYEPESLGRIHAKANTAKSECFFVGFLDGILANERVDPTEVEPLLAECEAICRTVGDDDAREILVEASAGHHDTAKELLDLLTQIAEIRTEKIDKTCRRSSANRLLGLCAGINCDGIITTREAKKLIEVLSSDHDLEDDPRIVQLRYVVRDALQDEIIDPVETAEISRLITALVGDSYSDTGIPSTEAIPIIHDVDEIDETILEGREIIVTGTFRFGSRREVMARLAEHGGIANSTPSRKTEIVIIGSDGSPHWTHKTHGGKLGKVLSLRANGRTPRIYTETQMRTFFT